MKRAIGFFLSVSLLFALSGCAQKAADKKMVSINYTGTLADGSTFDTSVGKEPLEFMVGAGQMIPGFEKAVLGMKVGEKKKFEIKAADAYGEYDKSAVQEVPMESFPKDTKLVKGMQFGVQTEAGPMAVTISEVKEKSVMVDFNHPLAGKDLTFDIEVMKIRDATKDELASMAAPAAAKTK